MFWSGGKLEVELENIVVPFDKSSIDGAAYTLKIGPEVYISPDGSNRKTQNSQRLYFGESFEIPSGQFAFLLTQEHLNMPSDVIALINVKSKIKMQGLVNVSGFHVDPGYSGRLVIAVFNAGPKSIVLKQGDPCFLIWFSNTDGPVNGYFKKGKGFDSIDSALISSIPRNNLSIDTLNQDVQSLRFKFNIIIYLSIILIPLISGLITVWYDK